MRSIPTFSLPEWEELRTNIYWMRMQLQQALIALQDALVTTIAGMSPERRAAFADRLEEELSRPRRPKAPARSGG